MVIWDVSIHNDRLYVRGIDCFLEPSRCTQCHFRLGGWSEAPSRKNHATGGKTVRNAIRRVVACACAIFQVTALEIQI